MRLLVYAAPVTLTIIMDANIYLFAATINNLRQEAAGKSIPEPELAPLNLSFLRLASTDGERAKTRPENQAQGQGNVEVFA